MSDTKPDPNNIVWDEPSKPDAANITWDDVANVISQHLGTGAPSQISPEERANRAAAVRQIEQEQQGAAGAGLEASGEAAIKGGLPILTPMAIATLGPAALAARAYGAYEGQKAVGGVAKSANPALEIPGRVVGAMGGAFFPEIAGKTLGSVMKAAGMARAALPAAEAVAEAAPAAEASIEAVPGLSDAARKSAQAIDAAREAATLAVKGGKVGDFLPGAERVIDGAKYVWGPKGGWFAAKAAEAVPVAAKAAEAVSAIKSTIQPITDPVELIAKIKQLREVNKLSGAQIAAALKQWHGVPMKDGTKAVKMVFDSMKAAETAPVVEDTVAALVKKAPADWNKMGGSKARLAWLQSIGKIPGAMKASDVLALKARGIPDDAILKMIESGVAE